MKSPRPLADEHPGWRGLLVRGGPWAVAVLLALAAALLYVAYRVLDPTPVRHIVLAGGPDQGAYNEFAKRYVPLLKAQGVTVELRVTQGSAQNLALLRDPASGVTAAFVQGGIEAHHGNAEAEPDGANTLLSLGSVAYEPLWLFYRADSAARLLHGAAPVRLSQLAGWRIDSGPTGGGSGPLFQRLAEANRLPPQHIVSGDASTLDGVVALVQGRVDALVMVSAAEAPFVQYLLNTPGVRVFDLAQSEAYARRFPFLHPLLLPRGVVDLATDQPPRDVHLVAATASLVVRADLHPALMQLLLQAAQRVHGRAGWFSVHGEFPNANAAEFALAPEAERFYRNGPPFLQRYLPFWLANFIDRMWIVLLPLVAVSVPLSRVLPPLVTLRVRSRVYRWYANLRRLERALERPGADLAQLRSELERMDAQTEHIGLPLAYTHELYELRSHIHLVRKRLIAMSGAADASQAPGPVSR
jgi:TRAP-type uncharacterized transport system substrate-binding protein